MTLTRPPLALVASALVSLLLACEPPAPTSTIPKECRDDIVLGGDAGGSAPNRRGQIKLIEIHQADGSDGSTVVSARFADFSLFTGSSQQGIELSATCVGLTGQPVRSDRHCEYTQTACAENSDCEAGVDCRESDRLAVAGVRIEGLANGDIDLDQQGMGAFIKTGLEGLYGSSDINMYLTASATAAHAFVHNDGSLLSVPAPEPVEITSPDISGGTQIEVGKDLLLRWTPGGDPDDLVYITLVAEQSFITNPSETRNVQVACVALDDGCQGLWASAIDWMVRPEPEWQMGDRVQVIVSRRVSQTLDLSDDTPDTQLSTSFSNELRGELSL